MLSSNTRVLLVKYIYICIQPFIESMKNMKIQIQIIYD